MNIGRVVDSTRLYPQVKGGISIAQFLLRISRHAPSITQLEELRRLLGEDVIVSNIELKIESGEHLLQVIANTSPDVVEVTLPLDIVGAMLDTSPVPIIRAVMKRKLTRTGAIFIFDHYELLRKVVIEADNLNEREVIA